MGTAKTRNKSIEEKKAKNNYTITTNLNSTSFSIRCSSIWLACTTRSREKSFYGISQGSKCEFLKFLISSRPPDKAFQELSFEKNSTSKTLKKKNPHTLYSISLKRDDLKCLTVKIYRTEILLQSSLKNSQLFNGIELPVMLLLSFGCFIWEFWAKKHMISLPRYH